MSKPLAPANTKKQAVCDFNNDGVADVCSKKTASVTFRDPSGGTVHADMTSDELAITMKDGTKTPLKELDQCVFSEDQKIWYRGMAYAWKDAGVEFYDSKRKKHFHAGELIKIGRAEYQITGFRIMIDHSKPEMTHTVALLNDCIWAEIDELGKVRERPQGALHGVVTGAINYLGKLFKA